MADTPDLGAAQEAFNGVEKEYQEVETTYNDLKSKFDANPEDEEIKTAFTGHETKYNETKTKYQQAKDSLFEALKGNVRTGYWPEDWRETYVNQQKEKDGKPLSDDAKDKLTKRLARYASPQAAFDALINAQNKISSGKMANLITKDSTPEEIAEYRKAMGIPDTPDGYNVSLSNGLAIGENDKERVNKFLEIAHNKNATPELVNDVLNWYYADQEEQVAQQYEADVKYHDESEEELRLEYGPEYKANINILANWFETLGEGLGSLLVGARLADGSRLGDHPGLTKAFIAKARAENPAGVLVPATGTKMHDAMMEEIATLEKKMREPGWHQDKKSQDRYMKLVEIRDSQKKK